MIRTVQIISTLLLCSSFTAQSAIVVTNGDLETGAPAPGGTNADVTGWYDGTNGFNHWQDTWHNNANHPTGFTGAHVAFSGSLPETWIYQDVGDRNNSKVNLEFNMDFGNFTGNPSDISTGDVRVSLYQSAIFSPADGIDIDGAAGVTELDSNTFTSGPLAAGEARTFSTVLSVGAANYNDPIYLRISWTNAGGNGWVAGDNFTLTGAVPEPSSTLLIAIGGLFLWR